MLAVRQCGQPQQVGGEVGHRSVADGLACPRVRRLPASGVRVVGVQPVEVRACGDPTTVDDEGDAEAARVPGVVVPSPVAPVVGRDQQHGVAPQPGVVAQGPDEHAQVLVGAPYRTKVGRRHPPSLMSDDVGA